MNVSHSMKMPVYTPTPGTFAGSSLGDPWFCITVHNNGLLPVTVTSVGLAIGDGTAPYMGPPSSLGGIGDHLPKPLASGEEANCYLDSLRNIADAHIEHGGAKWATATLAGGQEFHGKRISKQWLDGWAKRDL